MLYFDINATAPLLPEAQKVWVESNASFWHNPSSPYRFAAQARRQLEHYRERLASILDCQSEGLIFTSGATEGNNAIFRTVAERSSPKARVLISPIEHPSVLEAASRYFADRIDFLPLTEHGSVATEDVPSILESNQYVLLSCMAANNETGFLQPWETLLDHARLAGCWFHCDASQWLGKLPASGLGQCDFLTGCGHKFGGPKGTGFLRIPDHFSDFHSLLGGAQEKGHRAGTENVPGIAAMIETLCYLEKQLPTLVPFQQTQRDKFEVALKMAIVGIEVLGERMPRLWNTSAMLMPKYDNTRWVLRLDKEGSMVSTGSACATGKQAASHVLASMKIAKAKASRSLRVSGGWFTKEEEWKELGSAFRKAWKALEADSKGTSEILSFDSL